MADLPVACTLTPDALRARKEGLLAALLRRAQSHEFTDGGAVLRFAAASETLASIGEAIEAERRCCRFLRFALTVEPDEGPMVLALTGPPGSGEFLRALLVD